MKNFRIEKLVRDKIPAILESQGIKVDLRILEQQEFVLKLKDKLVEEAGEVLRASPDDLCEELADVLEVLQALVDASGLTLEQIEHKRSEKRELKGGFDGKKFLVKKENSPVDCLFCQKAFQENRIASFDHCYAIKDKFPVSNGHVLIIPYAHTENWFTAPEEVRIDMMKALDAVKEQLDLEYCPHGYNLGANCGEVAGQTVMHLHFHLIPRYRGDMEDPKGGVRGVIPK